LRDMLPFSRILLVLLLNAAAISLCCTTKDSKGQPPHNPAILRYTHYTVMKPGLYLNHTSALADSDSNRVFLAALKTAVKSHDFDWLDKHIDYPLVLCGLKGVVKIRNRSDLVAHYDEIFSAPLKRKLLAAKGTSLIENSRGIFPNGVRLWFLPIPSITEVGKTWYCIEKVGERVSCLPDESEVGPSWSTRVFFIQLKWAVRIGDKWWIADHMLFPTLQPKGKGWEPFLKDKEEFIEKYDSLWKGPRDKVWKNRVNKGINGRKKVETLAGVVLESCTDQLFEGGRYGIVSNDYISITGLMNSTPGAWINGPSAWMFIYDTPYDVSQALIDGSLLDGAGGSGE
jgi:hypothetical protein